jgi:hypothetical protein
MDLPYHNLTLDCVDCVVHGLGVICYAASEGGARYELLLAKFLLRTVLFNSGTARCQRHLTCELRASLLS